MSIIAAYYYNEGKRVREIALDEHVKSVSYTHLTLPTNREV